MRTVLLSFLLALAIGCLPEDEERCYNADDSDRPSGSHLVLNEATGKCERVDGVDASTKDASMDATPDAEAECSDSNACTDRSKARCNQGTCEKCTDHTHCNEFPSTPVCSGGKCIECAGNAQCDSPLASRCFAGSCTRCESDGDCSHIPGKGVCHENQCVQCTSEKDAACTANDVVCNVLTNECSEEEPGQTAGCFPCVASKQCAGNLCVTIKEGETVLGNYCLPESDPVDGCTNEAPLSSTKPGVPIEGGDELTLCYPARTTCEGITDTSTRACTKPVDDADEGCGRDDRATDGYCVLESGENYVCTTQCVNVEKDCLSGNNCVVPPGRDDLPDVLRVCPI